jgi:HK97 family phage prohead protease
MNLIIHRKRLPAPEVVIHLPGGIEDVEPEAALPDSWAHWNATFPVDLVEGKGFTTVRASSTPDAPIQDYQNVSIAGRLSMFGSPGKLDRQGEYVQPGAFKDTMKAFMMNPVMLRDHRNSTDYVAGQFTKAFEDNKGLYVEGALSNAPDMQSTRFKVAEGSLRGLSIGGLWHYGQDGRGIEKANLVEGSIVPVPAHSQTLFRTRSLNFEDLGMLKAFGMHYLIKELDLEGALLLNQKAAKLNGDGASHAASLIAAGKITKSGAWSAPSAAAENSFIKKNGFGAFKKWYLGTVPGATAGTKGSVEYPFSADFKTVSIPGLRAVISRAGQAGAPDVEKRAQSLLAAAKKKVGG